MNNNKTQDMNTATVGSILLEMRTRSGYSISEIVQKTTNQRLSNLSEIESDRLSINCNDLYQLLKIYSLTKKKIYFFCTTHLKGLNLGTK